MWYLRTFQWNGNWINRHENKIWNFKKLILNFEFNLSITVSLRKDIKEGCSLLNLYQIWSFLIEMYLEF